MDLLKVSTSPHVRGNRTTRTLMLDVIIALIPVFVWAIYIFGVRVITLTSLSVVSCILFEYLFQKLNHREITIGDFSAVLSGVLLAFNLPVSAPLWLCVIGAFFAIVVVKQLFGGLGKNFVNPVLAARVFLFISFPHQMTTYVAPLT
ncbi:MAG TPA: Na+-transporting NADH:ubiquinone oxidoreductase subunit D, partial [Clostridiales bacterium]|nr:Na+-transporting NADH:ubiquinone oxidoreductase subunit D [Clostridiales bacterium]